MNIDPTSKKIICIKKTYDRVQFTFGGILNLHSHCKDVLFKPYLEQEWQMSARGGQKIQG